MTLFLILLFSFIFVYFILPHLVRWWVESIMEGLFEAFSNMEFDPLTGELRFNNSSVFEGEVVTLVS